MPLLKVIEASGEGASSFQFAHLSFQEGLFAQALVDGSAAGTESKRFGRTHRKLLGTPWFLHALTIGGSAVVATLKVEDGELELGKAEADAMAATQWALIKESAVTSLKCATRPKSVCFCVSAP